VTLRTGTVLAARAAIVLALTSALATAIPAAATAATPRASLTDIENDVMCVVCKTPLAVSQSPEADRERAFINLLIVKGETKSQIERALVAQYGPAVLGLPPAHGFNLTVYVLPPALVLLGGTALAFTLPRWRRRTRASAATSSAGSPPLKPSDARRLEDELGRYGR
jgi:cytochrome c-type biogenesis protein CcmH/NrfF